MATPKNADLFAIPLPQVGFLTGHVLLSMKDPATLKHIDKDSPLLSRGTLLIDVYGPPMAEPAADASEILIRGIWTDTFYFDGPGKPRWKVIGKRAVDPPRVEYPEWLINWSGTTRFERGEIRKQLDIPTSELDRIDCRVPFILQPKLVNICINLVGRSDLLGEEAILYRLDGHIDLRYNEHRAEVYRALGEDPNGSYWDWATAEGLDPGRFWR